MSRNTLSVLAALILMVGLAAPSRADVRGSMETYFIMIPMGTQTESVKFFFDIQTYFGISVTISGLTFMVDTAFGPTGLEYAILNLDTTLGALHVFDQFVFAEPFGCTQFADPVGNGPDDNVSGQCMGQFVVPLGDKDGNGVLDRGVGFVKKRITLELNIAGITLTNLAIFEDVDFPDIQGQNAVTGASDDHEHDHFNGTVLYDLSGNDNVVDNQTPTFGFGDVISVSGQTVSGITVSGTTALCANPMLTNYIKKRSFATEVNKACTAQAGGALPAPIEDGAKTPLVFEKEMLSVEGLEIGGLLIDIHTVFLPLKPISTAIDLAFNVLNLFDVTAKLQSNNLIALSLDTITLTATSGNLTITLVDEGGDLSIDRTKTVFSLMLNPGQNPFSLTLTLVTDADGLTSLTFDLGMSRSGVSLDTITVFSRADADGGLAWTSTRMLLSTEMGNFNFGGSLVFTPGGMPYAKFKVGVEF